MSLLDHEEAGSPDRAWERLYEEAREANQAMDGFVSMVVHELRGPLTVIGGYAGMIARGELGEPPEAWARPLNHIVEHAARMRHLVDDLLLAARLSAGRQAVRPVLLDLRASVLAALDRAIPRADLAGIRLEGLVPDHPVTAVADPEHVDRILDNLLGNALAYGAGSVFAELVEDGGGADIRVSDDGRGVAAEMRERIFERFVRGDERHSPPGTGLGLHISRELASQLGGSVRLEAGGPGEGSTFVLRMPLAEGDAAP